MNIRRLTLDDLGACATLAKDRDWLPEGHKWRLLFEVGEVYGLDAADGDGLASTAILTRYGDDHAVISMVLTASRYVRQGLARRLMEHCLEQAGDRVVALHATDNGRPLYEKLGFRAVGAVAKHSGVFTGPPSGATRLATELDLDAICALDAEIFGTDRSPLLRRMPAFGEQLRVSEDGGRLLGYGHAWRNDDNVVIGPVVAQDLGLAKELVADLAASTAGEVRMDLDLAQAGLVTWAGANGVGNPWQVSLMVRDGELPGDRTRQFLPFMQALG